MFFKHHRVLRGGRIQNYFLWEANKNNSATLLMKNSGKLFSLQIIRRI